MIHLLKFLFLGLLVLVACQPEAPHAAQQGSQPAEQVITKTPGDNPIQQIEPKETLPKAHLEKTEKPVPISNKEEVKDKEVAVKEKAVIKKRPRITFLKDTYNFGTIMQGDKVEHKFKFVNEGEADLLITNVSVSCGCTHPSYPFIPIEPGAEGTIGVVFDSKGKLGRQIPTITVVTNARTTTYQLKLEGFVDAEREQTPPSGTPQPEEEKQDKEEGL